jgi:hypothetical protein
MQIDPKDPAKRSPDYTEGEIKRKPCRDLMGGTRAMREAGTEYLPKEVEEEDADYNIRLDRTFLYNGFRRTVYNMSGRVFDKPVIATGHDRYEEWSWNVTNDGRNLTTFARDLFLTGLSEGLTFLLADYPDVIPPEDRASQIAAGLSPYLVEIEPKDLIYWEFTTENSRPVLSEVRFIESYVDDETNARREQVKIIQLVDGKVEWSVYRTADDNATTWELYSEPRVMKPMKRIPVIPVYFGERTGLFLAEPPLMDLADMNIAHWQSYSDQRHCLHIARIPVLFTKGLSTQPKEKIVIGVNRAIHATDPNADVKYIEHTGAAIGAGRDDLLDLERRMGSMGIELLMPNRTGDLTATGKAINKATEESALQIMAKNLQGGLTEAFALMGEWVGITADPEIDMNTSFELIISEPSELTTLDAMRMGGELSRLSYWQEMKRRGVLREDFDEEVEMERLAEEAPPAPAPAPAPVKDEDEDETDEDEGGEEESTDEP